MKKLIDLVKDFGKDEVKEILLAKFIEEKIVLEALQTELKARKEFCNTYYSGTEKDLHLQLLDLVFGEKIKQQEQKVKRYSIQYLSLIGKLSNKNGYSEDQLQQARNAPIETLINTQIRGAGLQKLKALCPFHNEKTPSFIIYKKDNSFMCFGCQKHGNNAIDFLMLRDGLDFKEAVEMLT